MRTPGYSLLMGRLVMTVCILSMLLSACGLKLPSQINLPTQLIGGDPQTLEAATAAAQERARVCCMVR